MKAIVAVDKNWAIGCAGRLLTYIPDDLKYFKNMTSSKVVIMGRKTYESLPKGSRPLPNRHNIVITTSSNFEEEGVKVFNNLDKVIEYLKTFNSEDVFIIGGESIYRQFLPYINECYVTKIDYQFQADTYYPNLDNMNDWELFETSDEQTYFDITYTWNIYKRNNEKV